LPEYFPFLERTILAALQHKGVPPMSRQFVRKIAVHFILLSCLLSLLPTRAGAWGVAGHRITARIAGKHLTRKTQAAIAAILAADKEDPKQCAKKDSIEEMLACVSTWPDDVKYPKGSKYSYTAAFHFVDIPINVPRKQRHYIAQRDCPPEGCSIKALADYRNTLLTSKDNAERAIALKFIVHLIGDLHQPLHNAQDRDRDFNNPENTTNKHAKLKGTGESDIGGNSKFVTWFEKETTPYGCWNLHSVWDDGIIMQANPDDESYANTLNAPFDSKRKAAQVAKIQSGTVIMWANDALGLAIAHSYVLPKPIASDKTCEVYKPDNTKECKHYDAQTCSTSEVHYRYHLGDTYFKANRRVVETQLAHGGLRLARYLNSIFDPASTK
jgi:hypothetical protein